MQSQENAVNEEESVMDDFSSVDFSMTEFNIKDSTKSSGLMETESGEEKSNSHIVTDQNLGNEEGSVISKCSTLAETDDLLEKGEEGGSSVRTVEEEKDVKEKEAEQKNREKICTGDGATCVECGKTFSHSFYFGTHISCHLNGKPFTPVGQCGHCGLVFSNKTIYSFHMLNLQTRMEEQARQEKMKKAEAKMAQQQKAQQAAQEAAQKAAEEEAAAEAKRRAKLKAEQEKQKAERTEINMASSSAENHGTKCTSDVAVAEGEEEDEASSNILGPPHAEQNNKRSSSPSSPSSSLSPQPKKKKTDNYEIERTQNESSRIDDRLEECASSDKSKKEEVEKISETKCEGEKSPQSSPSTTDVEKSEPNQPSNSTDTNAEKSTEELPKKRIRRAPVKFEITPEVRKPRPISKKKMFISNSSSPGLSSTQSPYVSLFPSPPVDQGLSSDLIVDTDPEVQKYLQSLRDMGLTVDSPALDIAAGSGYNAKPLNTKSSFQQGWRANEGKQFSSRNTSLSYPNQRNKFHERNVPHHDHDVIDITDSPPKPATFPNTINQHQKNFFSYGRMGPDSSQFFNTNVRRCNSLEVEREEIARLMRSDQEVMPKSGKGTRAERLKQRRDRMSQNEEELQNNGKKPKNIHYNPTKETTSRSPKRVKVGANSNISIVTDCSVNIAGMTDEYKQYLSNFQKGSKIGKSDKGGQGDKKVPNQVKKGDVKNDSGNKMYGASWIKKGHADDDDDDVQIIDIEVGSSTSSNCKRSAGGVMNGNKKRVDGVDEARGLNPKVVVVDCANDKKAAKGSSDPGKSREESRRNVEAMLASLNDIAQGKGGKLKLKEDADVNVDGDKKEEEDEKHAVPMCIEFCGDKSAEENLKWGVEERRDDEEQAGERRESEDVSNDKDFKDVEMNKEDKEGKSKSEEKEEEEGTKEEEGKGCEGEKVKDEEETETMKEEGNDVIDGWKVSVSAVSDSDGEGEEEK